MSGFSPGLNDFSSIMFGFRYGCRVRAVATIGTVGWNVPKKNRTSNLQLRRLTLYPVELWRLWCLEFIESFLVDIDTPPVPWAFRINNLRIFSVVIWQPFISNPATDSVPNNSPSWSGSSGETSVSVFPELPEVHFTISDDHPVVTTVYV